MDSSSAVDRSRWLAEEVQPHETALRVYLRNSFPSVEVEDVIQETYLKLLKARVSGHIASTRAYFFSVARNTAITWFRRRKVYSEVRVNELPGWQILDGRPQAAEILDTDDRLLLVSEALDRLPGRCREVLRLAVLRGKSNPEIAVELGMTESTVRVHLVRGIQRCAGYLRKRGARP